MFTLNRTVMAVVLALCLGLGYSFAVIPGDPRVNDPACSQCGCRMVLYWWQNGEPGSEQCRYIYNSIGGWSKTTYAKKSIKTSQACTAGTFTQKGNETKAVPSSTKRICNGAQVMDAEEVFDELNNVDTRLGIKPPYYICDPGT